MQPSMTDLNPTRRQVLQGAGALALGAHALEAGAAARRPGPPDVLLIIADQHRADAAGFAGCGHATTPALDALAARSVRLTDAYCQVPLCVPARQSLLTGRFASSHGSFRNRHAKVVGERTFAHAFRDAGYHTLWVGKTHCNVEGFADVASQDDLFQAFAAEHPGARQPGEEFVNGELGTVKVEVAGPQNLEYLGPGEGPRFFMERAVVDAALARLARRPEGQPVLAVASFLNPHPPLFPPAEFLELYRDADLPFHGSMARTAEISSDEKRRRNAHRLKFLTDDHMRNITRAYHASIAWMDHCVGRLLAGLGEHGLGPDTLVVYTSDHGEMLGEHGLLQKRTLFEGAARVPLLCCWPGRFAPATLERVVQHVDLVATLHALTGVPAEPGCAGRSFAPLLRGAEQDWDDVARVELSQSFGLPAPEQRRAAPGELPAGFRAALREGRWKYIEHSVDQRALYDLVDDPGEGINRVADDGLAERVNAMRARLTDASPREWAFHVDEEGGGRDGEDR
jgi:arylsulfatase A-like enzyme